MARMLFVPGMKQYHGDFGDPESLLITERLATLGGGESEALEPESAIEISRFTVQADRICYGGRAYG